MRHTLRTGRQHGVCTGGFDLFHACDTQGAGVLVARHHARDTAAHGVLAVVFHLNDFNALNGVDEFARFVVNAHLATQSARIVIGDSRASRFEVHVKALLDQEFSGVHDLHVFEFVISGEGSETFST